MRTSTKIIALCTVALTALNACKKDDGGTSAPDTPASIEGQWEATHWTQKTTLLSTNPPTVVNNIDSTFSSGKGFYIRFDANSAYLSKMNPSSPKGYDSGSYTLLANKSRIDYYSQVHATHDTFNIAVTSSTLTITRNDTISGYHVDYNMALKRL